MEGLTFFATAVAGDVTFSTLIVTSPLLLFLEDVEVFKVSGLLTEGFMGVVSRSLSLDL